MSAGRLFQMINIMLEQGTVTAKELADRFEVSVRTIYRDVDTLSVSGIPIYTTKGKGGGISLLRNYVLDKSLLTGHEQEQLLLAIKNMPDDSGEMKELLEKLGAMFRKTQADWMEVDLSRWGMPSRKNEYFQMLKEAILGHRVITFSYIKAYSQKLSWRVYPLRVVYKSTAWYLQAYAPDRGQSRTFKLGRMSGLHVSNEVYEGDFTPPPIDVVPEDDDNRTLVMRFDAEMAFRVLEEFDSSEIREDADGRLIVTARMPEGKWLFTYLLSFGSSTEILEPEDIRESFAQEARKIYEGNTRKK